MFTLEEIAEVFAETVKSNGNNSILLFHCVSSYPASVIDSNIRNIEYLQKEFGYWVGFCLIIRFVKQPQLPQSKWVP